MKTTLPGARAVRVGRPRDETPPRKVPLLVALELRLGGIGVQLLWLLTLAGVGLCIAIIPRIHRHQRQYDREADATITTDHEHTVEYRFKTPDGREFHGHADDVYERRGIVTVLYDSLDPTRSDVRQYDETNMIGPGSLLLLLFPGGGLILAILAMATRTRDLRLMRYGRDAIASFSNRDVGSGRNDNANDRLIYVSFEYTANATDASAGPNRIIEVLTRRTAVTTGPIPVLYDPAKPDRAMAIADLPGRPRLEGDRYVTTRLPSFGVFLLPLATLAMTVMLVVKSV